MQIFALSNELCVNMFLLIYSLLLSLFLVIAYKIPYMFRKNKAVCLHNVNSLKNAHKNFAVSFLLYTFAL